MAAAAAARAVRRLLVSSRRLHANIPGKTIIGENNVIGHHTVVGVKCQDLKYKFIGDNNLIMGSCHIAHDCRIGNNNIFANSTLFAGHVVVEDFTHTAGAVVVHQFCHIGSYSFLGGGSVVAQDVPRYMMVAGDRAELRGLNLEGLKRNGFSDKEVRMLRKAYRKIFMPTIDSQSSFEDRLAESEWETELSETPVSSMLESIRMSFGQGRRGICKYRSWNH
uniref:UDP N-acetylglucosamine O-acyltransferase C-terminal domain-containing protein n=1 Tax=Leersia perrieri TaxID=77586 RepID=A0A0D9V534_9ORYZ